MTGAQGKDGIRETSDAGALGVEPRCRWKFGLTELLVLAVTSAFLFGVYFAIYPFSLMILPLLPLFLVGYAFVFHVFRKLRGGINETVISAALMYALVSLLASGIVDPRELGNRAQCANNLKVITLALDVYHERYGSFPPAYVADAKGRPMHSWRVLILPFMEQEALYKQYRFDEPWNGLHNRRLHTARVATYECPEHGLKGTMTSYVAVVGPETAWPGTACVRLKDIKDGAGKTLMVTEIAESGIHWMEPRDLEASTIPLAVNPTNGQGISSLHRETSWRQRPLGAWVGLADGCTRFLPTNTPSERLRALLTISRGETIDWDNDRD